MKLSDHVLQWILEHHTCMVSILDLNDRSGARLTDGAESGGVAGPTG
jgi:hypothetical protein